MMAILPAPESVVTLNDSDLRVWPLADIVWLAIEEESHGWQFAIGMSLARTGKFRTGLREDDAQRWREYLAPRLGKRLARPSVEEAMAAPRNE